LSHREAPRPVTRSAISSSKAAAGPASGAIRIALVSDSALFRSGLRSIFGKYPSFALVGEANSLPVSDLVRASAPHILLVDANIEGVLAACAEPRQNGVRPKVIVAGADGDDAWAFHALKSGARGILSKSATVDTLLKAVRVVHQGEVWASHRVLTLIVEELASRSASRLAASPAIKARLSERERNVAQLTASGLSNLEVAKRLGITEATVKAHLTHIFQKLMLRGRGELAAFYYRSLSQGGSRNGARTG
jgi:DNA-binding NarL/FixJ family response regulator